MLARAEGDVQLLQQKVKDLDVLMGTQWELNGVPGYPPKLSFFDGRNRDLCTSGVRHSQTKPFTQ